ncbi:type II toxin-antitoxin system RelE/ParE family toxin [Phaeocystidibacter luteus]|uniref:Plasmid maintenance system killer family protein n=1 Tax=Phaeocystidibacter luteus TaxID=911197 RepID=A0A6N6RMH4_9FLAO|nr:type II toxin-antitoxin system RelE/ParE family toxin [Phaeocystidibacter luteus]KAB2814759.1 plasmid maintenance system killer family protein [Phaeocystidibacter luteus]
MIASFGSKDTIHIYEGHRIKKPQLEVQNIARRKLRMLHNSKDINDLRVPPSNRLEKLSGNLREFYSIRVNKQWRIIFKWKDGQALDVELIDYH